MICCLVYEYGACTYSIVSAQPVIRIRGPVIHKDCYSGEEDSGDVDIVEMMLMMKRTRIDQSYWLRGIQEEESHATAWS